MKDAEISLMVAGIMELEGKWKAQCSYAINEGGYIFDYPTDDALGKMCVWLANNPPHNGWWSFEDMLNCDNPHRALADAIIEIGEK